MLTLTLDNLLFVITKAIIVKNKLKTSKQWSFDNGNLNLLVYTFSSFYLFTMLQSFLKKENEVNLKMKS